MKLEPIHHVPMRPEYNSPFSAAYSIEGGRLIFFSGCCTVPTYHKHPHDPDDERKWLAGRLPRADRAHLPPHQGNPRCGGRAHEGRDEADDLHDRMDGQNILNEISARYFGNENPPARSLIGVPTLAHPGMLIEIEGVAAAARRAKMSAAKLGSGTITRRES